MVYHKGAVLILATLGLASAAPVRVHRREVPQEHSHEAQLRTVNTFLKKDNPDGIVDAVFALLGNAAAVQGIGKFAGGPDCLQTGVADRAFTNAKKESNIEGMTAALIFRAIERNTGSVGLRSVACTQFTPVNSEIAALTQHQDPAASGAATENKAITLELARQISSIGGNPQDALLSGTFRAGKIGDPTARGNTCDDANDAKGCIFSQNLIVFDATANEIDAAVANVSVANGSAPTATTTTSSAAPAKTTAISAPAQGSLNFGSCTDPTVKFGAGLDGRKATEFSFLPNNQVDFKHGSALNPDIIYQFQCDTLVNKCGFKREDAIVATCQAARTAANALGRTGASADKFNEGLGFKTEFSALDNTSDSSSVPAAPVSTNAPASGPLTFGSCSDPTVKFGPGLDGRKATEFSFLPNNLVDFDHNSALNPDIIYQFQCDTLVNKCGFKREDAVVATCQAARAAANALGRTGASADKFNQGLGFRTDFAALDTAAAPTVTTTSTANSAPAATAAPAPSGALDFGSCSNPTVQFGAGLDGRGAKEFSFQAVNLVDFPHGSALNSGVITDFICLQFINKCGLKDGAPAIAACRQGKAAADALGKVGAAADAFNKAMGFTTSFSNVKIQ